MAHMIVECLDLDSLEALKESICLVLLAVALRRTEDPSFFRR